jgi:hypothetical protein
VLKLANCFGLLETQRVLKVDWFNMEPKNLLNFMNDLLEMSKKQKDEMFAAD